MTRSCALVIAMIMNFGVQCGSCLRLAQESEQQRLPDHWTYDPGFKNKSDRFVHIVKDGKKKDNVCLSKLPSDVSCSKKSVPNAQYFRNDVNPDCDWGDLRGAWKEKQWVPAVGTCPKLKENEFRSAAMQHRHFYFFGNSVTRHYASALNRLLKGQDVVGVNRKQEKKACKKQPLPGDSCDFGDRVHFRWKNTLSAYKPLDDLSRDICARYDDTEACLRDQFKNATGHDVLVVGSLLGNQSYMQEIHGDTWASIAETGQTWNDCALHNNNSAMIDMLLNAFPGVVIWHSYPALDLSQNLQPVSWDINLCYRNLAMITRCAIDSGTRHPRAAFIDLFPMQSQAFSLYSDMIHHPGVLSKEVLSLLLAMLPLE